MLEDIPFSTPSIQVVSIILGLAVLVLGRKLFWLFVGVAGFVFGLNLATELLGGEQADWLILAAGLAVGLLGAVVAIVVQRIAIGIASCLARESGSFLSSAVLWERCWWWACLT
jgi:hypothetical protein